MTLHTNAVARFEATPSPPLARILIADDHDILRLGVRRVLEAEPGWEVCGEATSGHEAIALGLVLKPDAAIIDISMHGLNGIDAIRRLRRLVPRISIVAFTIHDAEEIVVEAFEAGARGYVLKSDSSAVLVTAVQHVLAQKTYVSDRLNYEAGLRSVGNGKVVRLQGRLTPREREVLQLVSEGRSNKEIASLLGISGKTAETHRARLMTKLNLHSVADLVRYAIRNHLAEP